MYVIVNAKNEVWTGKIWISTVDFAERYHKRDWADAVIEANNLKKFGARIITPCDCGNVQPMVALSSDPLDYGCAGRGRM